MGEGRPLVSIVVPCYNVEGFLPLCLESIQRQTFVDYEVVLVDDGSTDGTGALCDAWAERDGRFRAVHIENGGLGHARNTGAAASVGELLMYVDGDDLIASECLETLVEAFQGNRVQMAIGKGCRVQEETREVPSSVAHEVSFADMCDALVAMLYGEVGLAQWCKLCTREFWLNHPIPEGVVYEDLRSTLRMVRDCERIAIADGPLYGYRYHTGSLTSRRVVSARQVDDYLTAIELVSHVTDGLDGAELQQALVCRLCNEKARVFRLLSPYRSQERYESVRRDIIRYMRENVRMVRHLPRASRMVKVRATIVAVVPWANDALYAIATRAVGKGLG